MSNRNIFKNQRIIFVPLLILLCLATATASTCNLGCKNGGDENVKDVLGYLPGKVYEYSLTSVLNLDIFNVTSKLGAGNVENVEEEDKGTGDESAKNQLKINAEAAVYVQENCIYTLQLNAVKIISSVDGVSQAQLQHLKEPIQFTLNKNGKVQPELCIKTTDAENHYALNIKRGIVSLLQTYITDDNLHNDVDIYGVCPTRTLQHDNLVIKQRNLNDCQQREHLNNGLTVGTAGVLHTDGAGIYNTPHLQADYYKRTKLNNEKIVEQVQVNEIYRQGAGAHSSDTIGAYAKVHTNLKLVKTADGKTPPNLNGDTQTVSIKFDAVGAKEGVAKNIQVLRATLNDLVPRLQGGHVQKGAVQQFSELVRLLRAADFNSLLELSNIQATNAEQKSLAHKVYLDALFRVGTTSSARVIIKLYPKLNKKEQYLAISSLHLIQHVDLETIKAAATILNSNNNKNTYLAIGHLVNKYCDSNSKESCSAAIEEVSKQFVQQAKHCQASNAKEEEHILAVLKGIGNIQHINSALVQTLTQCLATEHDISQRLRVAALQTVAQTSSCENVLQQRALQILKNIQEDSELRIEAYLTAVECVNEAVVETLTELLAKEPSQQVLGFIYTHLRVLRDSTDETRAAQRQKLENVIAIIQKNVPLNWRRLSLNQELSYKFPSLGASASGDIKLIYSQQPGFLPRSAHLNLTSELFGHNINLLELNARQENIERVLEYYLGPKGLFNKDVEEISKIIGSAVAGHPRSRRSLLTETQKIAKKYKNYGDKKAHNLADTPLNLDLSLKVFGCELGFLSLGDNIPQTFEELLTQLTHVFETTKKDVKDFSKQFYLNTLFLDSELLYSTSIGVPLALSAQGFATSQYDVALQFDVDAFIQNWSAAKYRLKFVPSIDAEVQLRLGYVTPLINNGIRVIARLYTATGNDFALSFSNAGKGFKAEIEFPSEQLDLLHVETRTDYYVQESDKPKTTSLPLSAALSNAVESKPSTLCFNQLEEYIGFDFCVVTKTIDLEEWANSAEAKAAILHPIDFHLYVRAPKKVVISGEQTQNDKQYGWKLNYATPNSAESHQTQLSLNLATEPNKNVHFEIQNPKVQFAAEVGLRSDARELVLYLHTKHNSDEHNSKIGFHKVTNNEYEPIIELQTLHGEIVKDIAGYTVTGRLRVNENTDGRIYTFDKFSLEHVPTKEQLTQLNGWVQLQSTALKTELHITNADKNTYFINSQLGLLQQNYNAAFFINDERTPDNVFGASLNYQAGQEWHVNFVGKAREWDLELYGDTKLNAKQPEFTIKSTITHKKQLFSLAKLTALYPTKNQLKFELELQRQKHFANLYVNLARNLNQNGHYLADIKANYNKHSLNLLAKGDLNENGRYAVDTKLTTSWGSSATLQGQISEHHTIEDIYIDLNGNFQWSAKQKPQQLQLKVIGASDKTTADANLIYDSSDLIKFNGEWQHAQEKTHAIKGNLQLKDLLTTKVDFKIAKTGKGELKVNGELLKSTEPNKKLDLNVKFNVQPQTKYDIDAQLFLNGEKPLQLFHIKTDNVIDKQKFSTENVIEIIEKKLTFNAHANSKGEWRANGELTADFALTLPDGQQFEGNGKRKLTTNPKTGVISGSAEWELIHTLNNGQKRTLSATGKLEKLLQTQKTLINQANWVYVNTEGKKLDVQLQINHVPKNHGKSHALDAKLLTQGDLLAENFDLIIKLDEYNCHLAKFDILLNFGESFKGIVKGNYDFTQEKPYTHTIDLSLEIPKKNTIVYKLHSNGKWLKPANGKPGQIQQQVTEITHNIQTDINFNAEGNTNYGNYDLDLKSTAAEPINVSGDYKRSSNQLKYSINAQKGDKYIRTVFDAEVENNDKLKVNYKLEQNAGPQVELNLITKDNKENYIINFELQHSENGKYSLDGTIYKSTSNKQGVSLYVNAPGLNKKLAVVSVFEKTGYRQGKLHLELVEVFGLDLNADLNVDLHDLDNLNIELLWNSEKLKLNQYVLKINADNGNQLHFNLKNAQETIVNGVLTHAKKEESNKSIIEGQGQLEYRGKKQQGNFRLIRQNFEVSADNEIGVSYSFSGQIGAKNGVANLKLTNKEFNIKLSACEEKKQCSNLQVQSLIAVDEQKSDSGRHSLLVLVDLRELGYPYEFELQSKVQRQGFKAQYNLDSKLVSNNNHRYELIASLSSLGAGQIQLLLPKREILLALQQQFPANNAIFGHYEQSVSLWLNHKQKPQEVTSLKFSGNFNGETGDQGHLLAEGSVKFEHPHLRTIFVEGKLNAQRAEQSVTSHLIFDVFKNVEQKIQIQNQFKNEPDSINWKLTHELTAPAFEFEYKISAHTLVTAAKTKDFKFSSGLEVNAKIQNVDNLTAKSAFEFSAEKLNLQVLALKEPLLIVESEWNRNKAIKTHTKLQLLSNQPIQIQTELDATSVKFSVQRSQLYETEASLKLGKEATIRVSDGNGQNFINGRIALDNNNFLQTQYESHPEKLKDHLKIVLEKVKEQEKNHLQKLKQQSLKFENNIKVLSKSLEDALPDLTPLQNSLTSNFNEILQELEADPLIKQISILTRKIVTAIEKFVNSLNEHLRNFYKHAIKSLEGLSLKIKDIVEHSLLPIWEKFVSTLTEKLLQLRENLWEIHVKLSNILLEIFEKYADVLKPYGKVLHDGLKAINEANQDLYKLIADELNKIFNELEELYQQFNLKNWRPFVERLQQQWKQWKISEHIVDLLKQLFDQLQLLPQTTESSEFLQQLHDYITHKITKQQTSTNIETLLSLLIKAIRSILLESLPTTSAHLTKFSILNSPHNLSEPIFHLLTHSIEALSKIPALFTLRLSVINFVINEINANWNNKHKNLKNAWFSLSLLDPFEITGRVINGQQFVTFDGLYTDYKAENCRFILTQDAIDQNFTIVGQQQHNQLRSLALITRDGETLEVFDNGNLKLNGANIEYPLHSTDLHAWQLYYAVGLRSQYGVELTCLKDLSACHIKVNGFYTGHLRGILGNGNTERFDDRLLPDGTLAVKSLDVGNAYSLGKCATSTATEDLPEHEENNCNELFNWKSTLSAGYLLLDPLPYHQGCNVALKTVSEAEQQLDKSCDWAFAYASALRLEHIPVNIPESCLKCGKNQPLHHEFNIKLPGNKADILFVINLQTDDYYLKNIVQPIFQELRESLKLRSFTDVHISVLAFNNTQRYPAFLSSNGGKTTNFEGNLANIDLSHAPANKYSEWTEQLFIHSKLPLEFLKVFNWLFIDHLPNAEKSAYEFALKYPFRTQASSVLVLVGDKNWLNNDVEKFLNVVTASGEANLEKTIVHLLAPIADMSVEGISKDKLLGFNSRLIATLDGKDPKKRSKLVYNDNSALRSVLKTGGWVFDNSHAANQPKEKIIAQISNTIADTSFKTEQATECKCESVYGLFSENKCTVKSTNFVPNKKVKAK